MLKNRKYLTVPKIRVYNIDLSIPLCTILLILHILSYNYSLYTPLFFNKIVFRFQYISFMLMKSFKTTNLKLRIFYKSYN